MQRLCFLCPNVDKARKAVAALRHAGVQDSNLFVIARHDIPLEELPATGIEDTTDALPGLKRGLAAGGMLGAIGGLVMLTFEELDVALGGAAIPLLALLGAGVGGFAGLLGSPSFSNTRLRRFEHAIEKQGKILLMVDATEDRIDEVKTLVTAEGSGIEFAGLEPRAPIVP